MNPEAGPVASTEMSKAARGAGLKGKINKTATRQEKDKLKTKSLSMNKKKKKKKKRRKFMKAENLLSHLIPVDPRAKS